MRRLCIFLTVIGGAGALCAGGWREEADARIEKHRKSDFVVQLTGPDGRPLANADVTVRQVRSQFGFGTAVATGMTRNDPSTQRYRQFILDHFNMLVCENAMKWWEIEKERDAVDYAPADEIVRFAQENDLPLRGHCLAWEKAKWTRPWQHALSDNDLREEIEEHLTQSLGRFKGKVVCWDVLNEILNGDFYTSKLGEPFRAHFFKRARQIDPSAKLFVNEYSILGIDARVEEYVRLIKRLRELGAPVDGIGVQDHGLQRFSVADPPPAPAPPTTRPAGRPMRPMPPFRPRWAPPPGPNDWTPQGILDSLDKLGELGLPIHLTEITSIAADQHLRARTLDMFFRIAYSHPSVEALILWGFWSKASFQGHDQALVDDDWNLTPAGKAVFDLTLRQWRTNLSARTDAQGKLAFRGFHGRYELTAKAPDGKDIKGVTDLTAAKTTGKVTVK